MTSPPPLDSPFVSTGPALEVTNLVKSYGGRRVVDTISLSADHGAVTAVLGPNGAGKTTTIECCEGLRQPDAGTITALGMAPADPRLRSRVGVMLQDGGMPTGVKAVELLRHVARLYDDPADVSVLVDRLGIARFATTTVRRLSGGQRQRLAFATALIGKPELLFLDEPSAGMDPQTRHAVWDLVKELRGQGVAIVLTTHLMEEAEALADHVVVVDGGTVIAQGSLAELAAATRSSVEVPPSLTWVTESAIDLSALAGNVPDAEAARNVDATTYRLDGVPVTPGLLAALAAECARQHVLITRWDAGTAGLEETFLALTGRRVR